MTIHVPFQHFLVWPKEYIRHIPGFVITCRLSSGKLRPQKQKQKRKQTKKTCIAWINSQNIILIERNQMQKSVCLMILLIWNVHDGQIYGDRKQISSCLGHGKPMRGTFWGNEQVLKLNWAQVVQLCTSLKLNEFCASTVEFYSMCISFLGLP